MSGNKVANQPVKKHFHNHLRHHHADKIKGKNASYEAIANSLDSVKCTPKRLPNLSTISVPTGAGAKINKQPKITVNLVVPGPQEPNTPKFVTARTCGALDLGNGITVNVPRKYVGDDSVQYIRVSKKGDDKTVETYARTLSKSEVNSLILKKDSLKEKTGVSYSDEGITNSSGKLALWSDILVWQSDAKSDTFGDSNTVGRADLFLKEANSTGILIKEYFGSKTELALQKPFNAQSTNVSEVIDSLYYEFGDSVYRVLNGIYLNADEGTGSALTKSIMGSMYDNPTGKAIEGLAHDKRHADLRAVVRHNLKKDYALQMEKLCRNWPKEEIKGWSDAEKLRCSAVQEVIRQGDVKRITQEDLNKYLPVIMVAGNKQFSQYIKAVYAKSEQLADLVSVTNAISQDLCKGFFSGMEMDSIAGVKERVGQEQKSTNLDEHVLELTTRLSSFESGGKKSQQNNKHEIKALRKEIAFLKGEQKIAASETSSIKDELQSATKEVGLRSMVSLEEVLAGLEVMRTLRDKKINGLEGITNKHDREAARKDLTWLDGQLKSVTKRCYVHLSPRDRIIFLQQESATAWNKYVECERNVDKSNKIDARANKELARKYHQLALTRESQLKFLLSSIEEWSSAKGSDFSYLAENNQRIVDINDRLGSELKIDVGKQPKDTSKSEKEAIGKRLKAVEQQHARIEKFLRRLDNEKINSDKTIATPGEIIDTSASEAFSSQSPSIEAIVSDDSVSTQKRPDSDLLRVPDAQVRTEDVEQSEQPADSPFEVKQAVEVAEEPISVIEGIRNTSYRFGLSPQQNQQKITEMIINSGDSKKMIIRDINHLASIKDSSTDSRTKKELSVAIKDQKEIWNTLGIKNIKFSDEGAFVTKKYTQNDGLDVEATYFYSLQGNGDFDENKTVYRPVSGKGNLKIPGVNDKIDTILNCSYQREKRTLSAVAHYDSIARLDRDVPDQKGILAHAEKIIEQHEYSYSRSMTKSELTRFQNTINLEYDESNKGTAGKNNFLQKYFTGNIVLDNSHENGIDKRLIDILPLYENTALSDEAKTDKVLAKLADNKLFFKDEKNIANFIEGLKDIKSILGGGEYPKVKDNNLYLGAVRLPADASDRETVRTIYFKQPISIPLDSLLIARKYPSYTANDERENTGFADIIVDGNIVMRQHKVRAENDILKDDAKNEGARGNVIIPLESIVKNIDNISKIDLGTRELTYKSIENASEIVKKIKECNVIDRMANFSSSRYIKTGASAQFMEPLKSRSKGEHEYYSDIFIDMDRLQKYMNSLDQEKSQNKTDIKQSILSVDAEIPAESVVSDDKVAVQSKISKTVSKQNNNISNEVSSAQPASSSTTNNPSTNGKSKKRPEFSEKEGMPTHSNTDNRSSLYLQSPHIPTPPSRISDVLAPGSRMTVDKDLMSTKSAFLNLIDFKKYYGSVDGEIAVNSLSHLLDAAGITLVIHGIGNDDLTELPKNTLQPNQVHIYRKGEHYLGYAVDNKGKVTVHETTGDGNCLFHAVVMSLGTFSVPEDSGLKNLTAEKLSEKTKQYLNDHFDDDTNGFFSLNKNYIENELNNLSKISISSPPHVILLAVEFQKYIYAKNVKDSHLQTLTEKENIVARKSYNFRKNANSYNQNLAETETARDVMATDSLPLTQRSRVQLDINKQIEAFQNRSADEVLNNVNNSDDITNTDSRRSLQHLGNVESFAQIMAKRRIAVSVDDD